MKNRIPKAELIPSARHSNNTMLAAAASSSDKVSTEDKSLNLPLSILGMIKGLPSPNEYIEMICPHDERMNLRKLSFNISEVNSQEGNYPVINVELSSYLKVVEALDYAQSVIKEFTASFEPMMLKENQLS